MLKTNRLFNMIAILCAAVCLGIFSFGIYAQTGGSLVPTGSFAFSSPDGALEISKYESQNGDQVVINGNYTSSQGQSFGFTSDSQNRIATFNLAGGYLDMHWLESGFIQLKAQITNGRSAVVLIDKNGNPQNPNSMTTFSEVMNILNQQSENGPNSFINFGLNNGFLNRGVDGTIIVDVQKILGCAQTMSVFGCVIASIALVASTAIMIAACGATGPGCIIAVIMQKLAIFSWIDACFLDTSAEQ